MNFEKFLVLFILLFIIVLFVRLKGEVNLLFSRGLMEVFNLPNAFIVQAVGIVP